MAFKDHTGAYQLELSEREQALTECVYGEGRPRTKTWDQLDPDQQRATTFEFLRKHPEKRPSDRDPIGPKTGLTQAQLDFVGKRVWDALAAVLPELVEERVLELVESDSAEVAALRKEFRDALHQIKHVDLVLLKNQIANGTRGGDVSQQSTQRDASLMDSIERRLSRNADHVQRVDERVRKLEGKA